MGLTMSANLVAAVISGDAARELYGLDDESSSRPSQVRAPWTTIVASKSG
jgi:hypothetical protein